MRKRAWRVQSSLILMLTLFCTLAAATLGGTSLADAEEVILAIPARSLSYFPLIVANEKGLFQAEGLSLKIPIMKTRLINAALPYGKVAYTTSTGLMNAAMVGMKVRMVMIIASRPQHVFIVRPEIASVKEMVGKNVGINSFGTLTDVEIQAVLRGHGVSPRDVTFLEIGDARVPALKSGAIHGTVIPIPFNFAVEKEGFKRLAFAGDYLEHSNAGLGTTVERIQTQREQVSRMVRAILKGIRLTKTNKAAVLPVMTSWYQVTPDIASQAYDLVLQTWPDEGKPSDKGFQKEVDDLAKLLQRPGRFMVADVADWSIVQEEYGKLK